MSTQFTATADPQGRFVTVVVANVAQDSVVTITRDPSPGGIVVRGTPVQLPAGGATVLTDLEHGYGHDITYTAVLRDPSTNATVETLTATVPAVVLPADGMVVSDPLGNVAVLVTVVDQRDERSRARHERFDLAGRPAPLFVTEYPAGWEWTDELLTADTADRDTLDGLLRRPAPVLLRVNGGCDLREGWVMPGDIDVRRVSVPASDLRRIWQVALAAVDAPDSTVEGVAVTLQDLHEWVPTTLQAIDDLPGINTLLGLSLGTVEWAGEHAA